MGNTIWVEVRDQSKEEARDNSILLKMMDRLDELSEKLNVPKLNEFCDYSDLMANFGGDESAGEDEPADAGETNGSWFDAAKGLSAVTALHAHLEQHPEELKVKSPTRRADYTARLMEDLEHCQFVLKAAAARGSPFRFLVVS